MPGSVRAQCDETVQDCNCLTMTPHPPVVDQDVTITLYHDGVLVPNDTPDEPICFFVEDPENELCPPGEDVTFNADGSITLTWTDEMAGFVADDGIVFVWDACCEGRLAEVSLQELANNGVGCTNCDGMCENPPIIRALPIAGMVGLGILAAVCIVGGSVTLRRRSSK